MSPIFKIQSDGSDPMTIETVRVVVVVFVLVLVRARFVRGAAAESGRREPHDDAPAAPPDGGEEDTPAAPPFVAAAELPASVCSLFCANQK